jgi:hypothetical protein
VLLISLTVGFLAPNQSVIPTFDPIGTLVANYSSVDATTSSVQTATNVSQAPTIGIKGTEGAEANLMGPFNSTNNATASFTVSSPLKSTAFINNCHPPHLH